MITIALAFLNKYIGYLRWWVLFASWIGIAWSVHHVDVLADKAAQETRVETVAQSIPKVITVTQTITRVIHDANDKCTNSGIPDAILQQLH